MSCAAPLRFTLGPAKVAIRDDAAATALAAFHARFFVKGFDPRLRVLVTLFYQPKPSATSPWPAVDATYPITWSAIPFTTDGSGARVFLQPLAWGPAGEGVRPLARPLLAPNGASWARPPLPAGDGFEFVTTAQGIAFDVDGTLTDSEVDGTWWALAEATPLAGVPDGLANALFAQLALEVGAPAAFGF